MNIKKRAFWQDCYASHAKGMEESFDARRIAELCNEAVLLLRQSGGAVETKPQDD